jgi:hypothetical protein
MNINFEEILKELEYRVQHGIIDLTKEEQVTILKEILIENKVSDANELAQKARVYFSYLNEAPKKQSLDKVLAQRFINPDTGNQVSVASALGYEKKSQAYKTAKGMMSTAGYSEKDVDMIDAGPDDEEKPNKPGKLKAVDFATDLEKEPKKDSESDFSSDTAKSVHDDLNRGSIKELILISDDLAKQRDRGIAGAGGPVASYGEARLTTFANELSNVNGYDGYVKNNKKQIENKKKEIIQNKNFIKNKKTIVETLSKQLGMDPTKDEDKIVEYLAARDHFGDVELQRLKADKESLWYKSGKQGFGENEDAFRDWAKADFDGAISTKFLIENSSKIDITKPHVVIQSNPKQGGHDDGILKSIEYQAKNAKSKEDKEHYEKEIYAFKKLGFHDTMAVGFDKKNRLTVFSITNKKADDLSDIWGNTTPEYMLKTIKSKFPPEVSKKVITTIDDSIAKVTDSKKATTRLFGQMKLDKSFIEICKLPEMNKYIDQLKNNKDFNKWKTQNGIKINSHESLLISAQQYAKQNEKAAYEPFGKFVHKVGELSQIGKFRNEHPKIDFNSNAVKESIKNKNEEKDLTASVHKSVVDEVQNADKKLGFPKKDGINGPHIQAYLTTVIHSMHFDLMVENFDGNLGAITGIRGSIPSDFREALAVLSGFKGNTTTPDDRKKLNEHLLKTCKLDPQTRAIIIKSESGQYNLAEDTWRTAGTSQKVEKKVGKDVRGYVAKSADERRKNNKK